MNRPSTSMHKGNWSWPWLAVCAAPSMVKCGWCRRKGRCGYRRTKATPITSPTMPRCAWHSSPWMQAWPTCPQARWRSRPCCASWFCNWQVYRPHRLPSSKQRKPINTAWWSCCYWNWRGHSRKPMPYLCCTIRVYKPCTNTCSPSRKTASAAAHGPSVWR